MKCQLSIFTSLLFLQAFHEKCQAEDGHLLWLRYHSKTKITVITNEKTAITQTAIKELHRLWLGQKGATMHLDLVKENATINNDGFMLTPNRIISKTDKGLLYGVYALTRHQFLNEAINSKEISNPSYDRRILNHWDNLDGTIERGYAGKSIFWRSGHDSLITTTADIRLWREYAIANASIGINGVVLNNVNASALMLSTNYLNRVKAIANVLRTYGIKVYLSIKFSSPIALGKLTTADPLSNNVKKWWSQKATEIYQLIPDFGGFLVKANSEGQPGPQDYGRTHADGANMLADILAPHGGVVMWRAFVYNTNERDRFKQAYEEFHPLDGKFRSNVILQVKNGPIDFQPLEPFSPLFGAMSKTALMPELQITQEYLGQSTHLAFLGTMWEEFLQSDTYRKGPGSFIYKCTDGSLFPQQETAIAGVANIGLDKNWCGHPMAQANWYSFGRLAWNPRLESKHIAEEWTKLSFLPTENVTYNRKEWENKLVQPIANILMESRNAVVQYMMPLGLHHIFSANDHYGPGPWWAPKKVREDWTPPYYHKADVQGIGFDRTATGSNALSLYSPILDSNWTNLRTCPDKYLLWFHHLPWSYTMRNGKSLWDNLCENYDSGVQTVASWQVVWKKLQSYLDKERFANVQQRLALQYENANIWKDACLLYFQRINKLAFPKDISLPRHNLDSLIVADEEKQKQWPN